MNQKRKFLDHYFRMYEMSELDGSRYMLKDEQNEVKRHLILANIPANYYNYTFKSVLETWSNDIANDEAIENFTLYYNNIEKAARNGTGLFITGMYGLAKTTAAIVVLKKAIELKYTAYFISMNDLVDFVTSGWKDFNLKLKYQYIVTNVDFLVVDDIDRNYHTQNNNQSTQFLDKLFVTRSNQKKTTILTSKYGIDSESDTINESLLTLFKSNLIELKVVGKDIREKKSKELVQQLKIGKKGK